MDLLLDLRREAGPLRHSLERELREAVRAGRLLPGATLPSTRALATQLGVSRGVVVEAYGQLVAEGYLRARQGAATVVAARAGATPARGDAAASAASAGEHENGAWRVDPHMQGQRAMRDRAAPVPPPRYDFRYGTPDLSAFPRAAWLAATARGLRAAPDARLGYGDGRGAAELRTALAAYLGRARGVIADPELMVVTAGTRQALGLVWSVLRDAGVRRVAIEDPGWSAQRETALSAGLDAVPIAVDERGLRVAELHAAGAGAVALTPAHQCPTGAVLAPERRAAVIDWARQGGAFVVEDDYDAEYRYDREPVGALQGMAREHVVYAGSASKTLAPALRLGWLVLPARLAAAAGQARWDADRGSPLPDQLALADLVERGELDRHLRRMRRRYRARRDALVAAVAAHLPAASVEGIAAGLHAVVRLPPGCDEQATVRAAAARGVALDGLAGFCHARPPRHAAVVLGYANLTEPAIARGIAELARALC